MVPMMKRKRPNSARIYKPRPIFDLDPEDPVERDLPDPAEPLMHPLRKSKRKYLRVNSTQRLES